MENIIRDIEEISTSQKLYHLTYSKMGLYIIYPFLALIIFIVIVLFAFRRDMVIELTGMISNVEAGLSVAPNVSGEIVHIAVTNHQEVESGGVIIMLDTSDIEREIDRKEADIEELNRHLVYLDYFETSIIEGENLLPSDSFGYSLRVEQHFRSLENDDSELNHLTQTRDGAISSVSNRISNLENLILDYQNFERLVNGLTYDTISSAIVREKINDFRVNLEVFNNKDEDEERERQKSTFVANTLLQIEQNISDFREEIRGLNEELTSLNRNFERDRESFSHNSLNASESLIIEIISTRESISRQIEEAEIELSLLHNDYENHVIVATADGQFQMTEQLTLGQTVGARSEIGRIINLDETYNYITAHFPSEDFNRVSLNQEVKLIITDGDNNRHQIFGNINLISESAMPTEHGNFFTLQAIINSEHSDLILRDGVMGELNIITGRTTIIRYLINKFF